VIAIDTQLLVYAHRQDSPWHRPARDRISELADTGARWAIPLHCLVEFYAVVTRAVYRPPSTTAQALHQIECWLESPTLAVLSEDRQTWAFVHDLANAAAIAGPRIYDARIAAVCLQHGVSELWTHDRDLSRFPTLRVRNPLIEIPPTRAGEARGRYVTRARQSQPHGRR
jgi:uncharacterized protein